MTDLVQPPDAGESLAIGEVLERFATWLRRSAPVSEWNPVALSTLSLLCRKGTLRVSDLVAAERISQPGMTNLLGRMETAGLVTRSADPTDGRATLVAATTTGQACLDKAHRERAEIITAHVRTLPAADQQALAGALSAIEALVSRSAVVPGSAVREEDRP